jgi:hypothetical protein
MYPPVKPVNRTFYVQNVSQANVHLIIDSRDNKPLYELQCHSNGYTADPDFDYSGDFECRLSLAAAHNTFSTLLTEDPHQSRDWESRGRFFSADLTAPCSNIPNFGAMRTFKLRNMILTLQILDPQIGQDGKLKSLRLLVDAREDTNARTPIASAVNIPRNSPPECRLGEYFVDPNPKHRN